jgi:hypothetical protein
LKVWNIHLSQIIFGRIQQQNIQQVPLSSGAVACGEAMKNGRKIIASTQATGQRLLKSMKFEGIEIAQFQIPSSFQIQYLLQFQSLRISYSLKAPAEERATSSNYRFTQQIKKYR